MVQPCAGRPQIENGEWGYGRVGLDRILKGVPHPFVAALNVHSARCPTFDKVFLNFLEWLQNSELANSRACPCFRGVGVRWGQRNLNSRICRKLFPQPNAVGSRTSTCFSRKMHFCRIGGICLQIAYKRLKNKTP